MKKFLLSFLFLVVGIAYADNTITSKEYVDGQVATLQTQIPAKNTNTVVTNTGTAGSVGEKAIYDTSVAYGTQTDALVTAGAFNSAIQNALESEFVCVEWQGNVHDNAHCLLYEVRGAAQNQILPSGYTQLEYLESTGTQYIDTSILWNNITRFRGKAQQSELSGLNLALLSGCLYQSQDNYWCFFGTAHWSSKNNLKEWYWDTNILPSNAVDFDIGVNEDSKWAGIINNVATTGVSITSFTDTATLMSAKYTSSSHARNFIGYVWYIQLFSRNNTLLFNGIPARRDSDGELGMYDLVSNTFFTNSGTGEFIAGPVVYF